MDVQLLTATVLAGLIYIITPGPAFFALLGLGAGQGRPAATRFMAGHLVGDLLWASLALAAVLGASWLGSIVFDLLSLISGLFLIWLGYKALRRCQTSSGGFIQRPFPTGLTFGLTNPKAYAVSTATFVTLLSPLSDRIGWHTAPTLAAGALLGFVGAYGLLALFVGWSPVRHFFNRYGQTVQRVIGAVFIVFGSRSFIEGAGGLATERSRG